METLTRTKPKPGTQHDRILFYLQFGMRLTVGIALNELKIYALSQRVGELKEMGWPIMDEWVTTQSGARIKQYYLGASE